MYLSHFISLFLWIMCQAFLGRFLELILLLLSLAYLVILDYIYLLLDWEYSPLLFYFWRIMPFLYRRLSYLRWMILPFLRWLHHRYIKWPLSQQNLCLPARQMIKDQALKQLIHAQKALISSSLLWQKIFQEDDRML